MQSCRLCKSIQQFLKFEDLKSVEERKSQQYFLKHRLVLASLVSVSMLFTVVYTSCMNFSPHDWLHFSCMIYRESYKRERERERGKKAKEKRELGLHWFEIIFWLQLASRTLFEMHVTPLKQSLPSTQLTFHIKKNTSFLWSLILKCLRSKHSVLRFANSILNSINFYTALTAKSKYPEVTAALRRITLLKV